MVPWSTNKAWKFSFILFYSFLLLVSCLSFFMKLLLIFFADWRYTKNLFNSVYIAWASIPAFRSHDIKKVPTTQFRIGKSFHLLSNVVYKAFLFYFFYWLVWGKRITRRSIVFKSIFLFLQATEMQVLCISGQELARDTNVVDHLPLSIAFTIFLPRFAIHSFTAESIAVSTECSSFF